jgi:hypothetical protein
VLDDVFSCRVCILTELGTDSAAASLSGIVVGSAVGLFLACAETVAFSERLPDC